MSFVEQTLLVLLHCMLLSQNAKVSSPIKICYYNSNIIQLLTNEINFDAVSLLNFLHCQPIGTMFFMTSKSDTIKVKYF